MVEPGKELLLGRIETAQIGLDLLQDLHQGIHFALQWIELIDDDNVLIFEQTMTTAKISPFISDLKIQCGKQVFELVVQGLGGFHD